MSVIYPQTSRGGDWEGSTMEGTRTRGRYTDTKKKKRIENKEQNLIKSEEDNYIKVCTNREEKKLKTLQKILKQRIWAHENGCSFQRGVVPGARVAQGGQRKWRGDLNARVKEREIQVIPLAAIWAINQQTGTKMTSTKFWEDFVKPTKS